MTVAIYDSEDFTLETGQNLGLVASVDVAGGSSGLVFTGGPITGTGTITITSGPLTTTFGGTGLSGITAGYIMYGAGTSAVGTSANLFWDSANSRLGLGTSSPSAQLNSTSNAIIGGSAGTPTIDVPVIQIGDGSYSATGVRTGIRYNSSAASVGVGEDFYAALIIGSNTSSAVPNKVVGVFSKGTTTENIGYLYGTQSSSALENSTGSINITGYWCGTVSGLLSNVATGARGASSVKNVWAYASITSGTNTLGNVAQFFADGSSTATKNSGVGSLSGATVTNYIGFYDVAPVTGTITSRYAFYAEDTSIGSAVAWNSNKYGFYHAACPTGYRSYSGSQAPWGYVLNGPKSVFNGKIGIGTNNPRVALEIDSDDSDYFNGWYLASILEIGSFINASGMNAPYLNRANGAAPAALLSLKQAPGTAANPTASQAGYWLGGIAFSGYTGQYLSDAAYIYGYSDEVFSASSARSGIVIATGKGSGRNSGWFDRIQVDSTGNVRMADMPYTRVYASGQNIANATENLVYMNTLDTGIQNTTARLGYPMWAAGNTQLTIQYDGVYAINAQIAFEANTTGIRVLSIVTGWGGSVKYLGQTLQNASSAGNHVQQCCALAYLTQGTVVGVSAYQTSTATINIIGGSESTWLAAHKVS